MFSAHGMFCLVMRITREYFKKMYIHWYQYRSFLMQLFYETSHVLCSLFSSPEEAEDDCQAEYTAEPMEVDSVPESTSKDEIIAKLEVALEQEKKRSASLENKLTLERFGVTRFANDDKLINFYTGFASYQMFRAFYECIEPTAKNMQSMYYQASETISLSGRKRCMLLIDELCLFLCRLRAGLLGQDLAVRFDCYVPTISRKIVTWANFLYFTLGRIPIWLSRETIDRYMPDCFKELYPNTIVIIDCTEIRTQQTSSLVLNSQLYSHYKGTHTFKCLIGIAPHGAVTFVSSLYTGCMSDVEITKLSGILDLLEPGDDVMADKGFTLKKMLDDRGVTLNIPPFLSSKRQFTPEEVKETEQIAKLRIHVERLNRRVKENHLFDIPIPMTLAGSANQLWTVACLLAIFNGPLVQSWSKISQRATIGND